MAAVAEKAQQEPHWPWSLTGVTTPLVRQSTVAARGPVAWGAVLYLGVVATALTTWLQTWGQRHVPAPQAAILYTLEPVWAAFFAYLALGERLSPSGLLGALLVLLATLLAIRRSPA